jgi:diguanylate cyclase (GGDEF)-like protein
MALIYAGGSVGSLLAALVPMSDNAPSALPFVFSASSAVLSIAVWVAGSRGRRVLLHLAAALWIAMVSLLVAQAATPQGAVVIGYAYLWVAVYAGHFFQRAAAWVQAALITAGYAVGMLVNSPSDSISAYVIVVATIWVAVTALSNLTSRMRADAMSDQLTGLLNRAGFRPAAERTHALAVRTNLPLTLAVIDLDHFKAVNDQRGHEAGDRLLVELATCWTALLRRCDVLGRHGGDEFVLLLPNTDEQGAQVVLTRLLAAGPISWSSGVAVWSPDESLGACLARADSDLYRVKGVRAVPAPRRGEPNLGEPVAR